MRFRRLGLSIALGLCCVAGIAPVHGELQPEETGTVLTLPAHGPHQIWLPDTLFRHSKLFDADTGEGIPGVPIYPRTELEWRDQAARIRQMRPSAHTDDAGEFRLEGLPPGVYMLSRGPSAHAPTPGASTSSPGEPTTEGAW